MERRGNRLCAGMTERMFADRADVTVDESGSESSLLAESSAEIHTRWTTCGEACTLLSTGLWIRTGRPAFLRVSEPSGPVGEPVLGVGGLVVFDRGDSLGLRLVLVDRSASASASTASSSAASASVLFGLRRSRPPRSRPRRADSRLGVRLPRPAAASAASASSAATSSSSGGSSPPSGTTSSRSSAVTSPNTSTGIV